MEGDGAVRLFNPKNGRRETIQYRLADGSYPLEAREQIDQLFGLKKSDPIEHMSLRFIALLDFIQDEFGDGEKTIQLNSAYRSPKYNQGLRDKGRTVAKASTHMEGMAADIEIKGVQGKYLWEKMRDKNCCGVGWYGKQSVHVDTGPARWWTGATSKVKTKISDHNKKILVRTDRDIYHSEEMLKLNVIRITEYPFGIRDQMKLVSLSEEGDEKIIKKFKPTFLNHAGSQACRVIRDRKEARRIHWKIPKRVGAPLAAPLYIRVDFCNKSHEEMPDSMLSNRIEIK